MDKEILIQSLLDRGYLKTPRIIDAFRAIDRADFLLPEYKNQAYGDHPLPIGFGQTISQPLTVAFMLELLDPKPGEKILDIGAGSGWQTALLAYIASERFSIPNFKFSNRELISAVERIPELCVFAKNNVEKYEFIKNGIIKFYSQDATAEIPDGPYDKIIAAAAASKDIPDIWQKNLKIGGKIVAPIDGSVWLFTKKSETEFAEKEYPGFSFVPLIAGENAKRKTQNVKPQLKTKTLFITALVFGLLTFGLAANEIYRPHTDFSASHTVEIPAGLGSRKIAELLKKQGVIRSKWTFVTYVSLTGRASLLKSGRYVFFSSYNIPTIASDLVRGGVKEREITIPEGWTSRDIAEVLEKEVRSGLANDFTQLVALRSAAKPKEQDLNWVKKLEKSDFLEDKPIFMSLEGYLFPDTYRFFVNSSAEDTIFKMLDNFDKKLSPDLRKEIARQKKTIFDVVTMASLIEKEVSADEDRALVAGILWKRLNIGMGLQVDATIIYLTGKKSIKVSKAETEIDSPYNTYKYRGLPPGPISNPGLSAIKAAIYPKESLYLYYLSTDEGKTIFSKTLKEHNLAKAKYLK